MKIEDLAYQVAGEAILLLEKKYGYHISSDHRKEIQTEMKGNVNRILAEMQKGR